MLVDVIDGADIGVIEGGGGLGLALEALQGLMVLGHIIGQELERYETVELGVLGLVDHAHAAAAQLFENPVMRNGLA